MVYPIDKIRLNFPILNTKLNNQPLSYLDSAASAQKPKSVIMSQTNFYCKEYAAVQSGIHTLSDQATKRMEDVRTKISHFINASTAEEIIFTKGTTESINLVANSWGRYNLKPGDNILITEMEHHANIVPWQMLVKETKAILRYIPLLPNGTLDISKLQLLVDNRTMLLAITQVSNVLGTLNPIPFIVSYVRINSNAVILIDGAQSVMHRKTDVQKLDCDFYVFSGHKIYAPPGIGILYAKKTILNTMPPWQGGGSMINSVHLTKGTTYNIPPWCFEAGSPNIVGIIGLGIAIDYIEEIGLSNIKLYEIKLMDYTLNKLKQIPDIILYGSYSPRIGVISFNLGKHHAYDVGSFLNQYGIAIRTGHHCAMPIMNYYNTSSMCRVSLAMYNNQSDIDQLIFGLIQIQKLLK